MKKIIYVLSIGLLAFLNLDAQIDKVYQAPEYFEDWNDPTPYPERIMLNLGEDPATSFSVTWRTDTTIESGIVEYAVATAAPKFWRTKSSQKAITSTHDFSKIKSAEIKANYHTATIENLKPNTLYAYRVGDGSHWSEWIQYKTASAKPEAFTFLYVGDAQNYVLELWSRLIREGYSKAPKSSFIIHAGDLINRAHNDKEWKEWFSAGGWIHGKVPSIAVPGNHEYRAIEEGGERVLSVQWKPQFNFPLNGPEGLEETVYYTDYQGVRFIALNSMARYREKERKAQMDWLEDVLKNNPNKWTIATYHHPVFSASQGRDNEDWREMLKPLFKKYNVDLALQGHDHSYVRGRTTPQEYNLVSGVNKQDQTGTVYVVSVSGGKMYNLKPQRWNDYEANLEREAENTQLFQVITVDGDKLSFESYTVTGELYDAFDLVKNENSPNTFIEKQELATSSRYHNNTISYYDKLPVDIEKDLMVKYKGYKINKVSARLDNGELVYYVEVENEKQELDLKLDKTGKVLEEEVDD